jgi:hypothetical protein
VLEVLARGDLIQAADLTDEQVAHIKALNPEAILLPFWSSERAWSRELVEGFRAQGFDGMYIDLWNDLADPAAEAPNPADDRAQELRAWWPEGYHVVNGALPLNHSFVLNGFMWEYFVAGTLKELTQGAGPGAPGYDEWERQAAQPILTILNDRLRLGDESRENRYDSFDFWKKGRYLTGLSLLRDGIYVSYNFGLGGSPHWASPWWLDEWEVDLGQPLSPAVKLPNGVWFREYSRGAVLVNDTGAPQTVEASMLSGGPYYRFRGNQQPAFNDGSLLERITLDGWLYRPDEYAWPTGEAILLVKAPQTAAAQVIIDDEAPQDSGINLANNLRSSFSHSGLSYNTDCGADPPEVYECPGPQFPDSWHIHPNESAHYGSGTARWCTTLGLPGHWRIYEWHPTPLQMEVGTGRFQFEGQVDRNIDFRREGGRWNLLWDVQNLPPGEQCVSLSGTNIVADAIMFRFVGAGPTFGDVPFDHPYYEEIETLHRGGFIAGCSQDPLLYCPEQTMTRAESAVFVARGIRGAEHIPPQPAQQIFADLPLESWAAKWAAQLWEDGYTAGCGTDPLIFCPWRGLTRTEGSVYFLRMMHGKDYQPSPARGLFADVPLNGWWGARWAEAAYLAGLIPACAETPELRFCPEDPLPRGLAAYMMVQAKGLGE